MDAGMILEWVIKSIFLILFMTAGFAYVTLLERRVLARMQVRIGPNRVGKFGLLQPIADAVKLIAKEELIPAGADKLIFVLPPESILPRYRAHARRSFSAWRDFPA